MFYKNIEEVITEKNIICFSPHYDDFLFFLGGYVLSMKKNKLLHTKKFTNISVYSRSNYQAHDNEGNQDVSLTRIKYATGVRLIEDLLCLDDLLGYNRYRFCIMGEEESQIRGKKLSAGKGEMEMAYGNYENMEKKDYEILDRIKNYILDLAILEDTAIVLPLAMKNHIDHFIVREAGIKALKESNMIKATFYFAEDKPYAGILNENEINQINKFIDENRLEDRAFIHYPNDIIQLAFSYYTSQVDDVYKIGVLNRSEQLKKIYKINYDCDRVFKYVINE